MNLNVPFFHQERNLTCTLACIRMVLAYYGDEKSEKEIAKHLKIHNFGTLETDLGPFFRNCGYRTTAYTIHLSLFGPLKLPFGTRITREILNKVKPAESDKMVFDSLKIYLDSGQELIWNTPQLSQLKYWLDQNVPPLITLNTTAMGWYHRHWDNGHAFIVEGIRDDGNLDVVDPNPVGESGKYYLDKDELLPAWAINARQSSNYLMVIYK